MFSSCYPEKNWYKSPNTTLKGNLREAFQLLQSIFIQEVCFSSRDGESSFGGHLVAVRKQMLPEDSSALPLTGHFEASEVARLIENLLRSERVRENGPNCHRVYISPCTTVNNNNPTTHCEGFLCTRHSSKPFIDVESYDNRMK